MLHLPRQNDAYIRLRLLARRWPCGQPSRPCSWQLILVLEIKVIPRIAVTLGAGLGARYIVLGPPWGSGFALWTFPPINQFTHFLTHMQKTRGRTTMGPPSASRFLAQPAPVLDVR